MNVQKPLHPAVRALAIVRFSLPLLMVIFGYAVPSLRSPLNAPADGVWLALFIELILAVVWIVAEVLTVVNRNTPVRHLQLDDLVSLWMAVGLTAWIMSPGQVQWLYVVPYAAVLLDATLSGWLAINNAAQKPIAQVHGS